MIRPFASLRDTIEQIKSELGIIGDAELFQEYVIPGYKQCDIYSDKLCLRNGNDACTREEVCKYRINLI